MLENYFICIINTHINIFLKNSENEFGPRLTEIINSIGPQRVKYLGITFFSDGRQDNELDTRIGKAKCSNAPALPISCTATRNVYERRAFCFQISLCSYPHLWS